MPPFLNGSQLYLYNSSFNSRIKYYLKLLNHDKHRESRLGQNFSSQTTDTRVGLFNIYKAERFSLKRQTHISEFNIYDDIYRLNGELEVVDILTFDEAKI